MIGQVTVDTSRVEVRLGKIGPNVREALVSALKPIEQAVAADARARAAAHIHTLGIKPGQYLASIYGGVSSKDSRVTAFVRSGHPLAHLLEYGAKVPPHEILPNVAAVLVFEGDAGTVFARAVHSPGATIPPYPAIHPAFDAAKADIASTLEKVVKETARRS